MKYIVDQLNQMNSEKINEFISEISIRIEKVSGQRIVLRHLLFIAENIKNERSI